MSDAPIDPHEYLYGVKVVQIEDLRVARGLTRRPHSTCRHKALVYCEKERRCWCSDCESEVEPFDAFVGLIEVFAGGLHKLNKERREMAEAQTFQARSRAVKVLDAVWRSKNMAPLCPHCNAAIMPEDVASGVAETSRSLVIAARKRKEKS